MAVEKKYRYRGKKRGRRVKGEITAETLTLARSRLRHDGIREASLKEVRERKKSVMDVQLTWGPFGNIPQKEIVIFSKKMATMIRSGLPIVDAMGLLADQTRNKNLKTVLLRIAERLNSGSSLSLAFGEHRRHFDNVYVNMIEAGEVSGRLDTFLSKLVEMLEKQQKIRSGVRSALFYPVTLIAITLLISYGMLTQVVPVFEEMYEGLGAELPAPTQKIVEASNWIRDGRNMLWLLGIGGAVFLVNQVLNRFYRPYVKFKSRLILWLPVFGDVAIKSTVARMSLLMANLLAAGVSVLETLEVSRTSTRNLVFVDASGRIKERVTSGLELSVLFRDEKVFPPALSQMMAVGEKTGNMDEMLTSIARYYEEEFDAVVEGLSSIIEPLMIVFVGAMIGVLVVALYLPIFSAGDAFS